MKKIKLFASALILGSFLSQDIVAQKLAEEKTIELTGKSKKKGYLGNVVVDDAKQQFDMVFVTKDKARKVKYEVYQFDYNFNLINNFEDEQRKLKGKRSKTKIYKGDYMEITGVTANSNLRGKLILKKTLYIHKWNWWNGRYETTKKLLKKEKPKELGSDGGDKKRKLFYTAHRDLSDKGELLVCALINKGMMKMSKDASREYQIMHIGTDLNVIKKTPLTFEHPQSLLFSKQFEDQDEWIMIFAPFGGQGYGKIADKDPTNLTFVRISGKGEILEKYNFKTKCNQWGIFDAYLVGENVYLYGAGKIDKPDKKYAKAPYTITNDAMPSPITPEQRMETLESQKFTHLQIVKLNNGKVEFISALSLEEINAKGIKPASQKKFKEFDGKKFILNRLNVTSNGDIFISGQDFSYDNVGKVKGRVYKNLLMFHYDKDGGFKRFYSVQNTAKSAGLIGGAGGAKSYPSESVIYESPTNPNDLFWNVFLCQDIDVDCSTESDAFSKTTTCVYTPLYQGRMGKINISEGTVSDFITFGGKDFYLYIDLEDNGAGKDLPYFSINGGKQIVYCARSRKGGKWSTQLWFGKFDPLKQ